MAESESHAFIGGRVVPSAEVRLAGDDHGVLFGLGFFETFRTSGGRPHAWERHRARLEAGCAAAGLVLPTVSLATDEARLGEAVRLLLAAQGWAEAVVRYTVTAGVPGSGPDYPEPVEWLSVRPLPPPDPNGGVSLRILNLRRDSGEWIPRPKSLNYANAWLGVQELRRRGAPATDEGLFLSREGGWVAETPRRSIAWVCGGQLRYPDPSVGAVAGTCLAWALDQVLGAAPRQAPLAELMKAEAILVLNAVRGVTAVHEVWDEKDRTCLWSAPLRGGHPLVNELAARWQAALDRTRA